VIILSLDASTTAVGWCLARDADHLRSGVYRPKGRDAYVRIGNLELWLSRWRWLVPSQLGEPLGMVFYERATGDHGNMETDRLLGAVEYVIVRTSRGHFGIEPLWVTASQVKASEIHKDTPDLVVEGITGRPLDDQNAGDEKDAIGVWLAGLKKWRERAWLAQESEEA
jgi:hypothetical protein